MEEFLYLNEIEKKGSSRLSLGNAGYLCDSFPECDKMLGSIMGCP